MKKIVLTLLSFVSFAAYNSVAAQEFSMQKDTARMYVNPEGFELHNDITNLTSSVITPTWKILSHTLPAGTQWVSSFGLCDNVACYPSSQLDPNAVARTMGGINPGASSAFKLQYGDVSTAPGTGPYYVTAELSSGTTIDTVTFQLNKYPTGINNVSGKANDNVIVYPNPARNEVNVVFDKSLDVKNIAVYNLIGKSVSVYRVSGNSAKLDIDNIPSGIYFIRLLDNTGHVLATRKFTHQ